MVGATVGALTTALVEGPLELFRHQAQAGLISGNLIKEMATTVRTQVGKEGGKEGLGGGLAPPQPTRPMRAPQPQRPKRFHPSSTQSQGPMGLYFGFLPYLMESLPYDISELGVYA